MSSSGASTELSGPRSRKGSESKGSESSESGPFSVIPSERSESRDLHFVVGHLFARVSRGGAEDRGGSRRRGDCFGGRAPRAGSPVLSIHDPKFFNGQA